MNTGGSVLMVSPPFPENSPAYQDLDLELALGFLRKAGVGAFHCFHQKLQHWDHWDTTRLVFWYLPHCKAFIALEQQAAEGSACLHFAFGRFVDHHSREILRSLSFLNGVVFGEPEETLAALAACILSDISWQNQPGILYRERGVIHSNAPRAPIQDLDSLGHPANDFFHPSRCSRGQTLLLSRGCNNNCNYCGLQIPYREGNPGQTSFWRSRSAASLFDELSWYYREKEVRHFQLNAFVALGYDQQATEILASLARAIIDARLELKFSFISHPQHLVRNRNLLPLLKAAGLAFVSVGLDSGNDRALKRFGLPFTVADGIKALQILQALRIPVHPLFIFYDPYLSPDEFAANLDYLEDIAPLFAHVGVPYSLILEKYFINTTLRVKTSMPVYRQLLEDGLSQQSDPLLEHAPAAFRSSLMGRVFQMHQLCNSGLFKILRPLYLSKACQRRPSVPLVALRYASALAAELPELSREELYDGLQARIWQVLGDDLDADLAASGLGEDAINAILSASKPFL